MSFTTNKYTRPVLLNEVRALNPAKFQSFAALANAISPRAGYRSAKVAALRKLTNRKIAAVFRAGYTGRSAKTFIVNLLND